MPNDEPNYSAIILATENRQGYAGHVEDIASALRPGPGIEEFLADYITISSWRVIRMINLEKAALDYQIREEAELRAGCTNIEAAALAHRTLADSSRCLDLMGRAEARCFRAVQNALLLFLKIRRELTPNAESASPERTENE